MNFLLIEDDYEIVETIRLLLEMRWEDATLTNTISGLQGVQLAHDENPDVVILDLGLPDLDGFQVLSQIREFSDVPIIILTVRGEESMKVRGLEQGADDYVTKPFSPVELLARLKAISRRTQAPEISDQVDENPLSRGGLMVDFTSGEVTIGGEPTKINSREYDLLRLFAANPGRVFSISELLKLVFEDDENPDAELLQHVISSLKEKIEIRAQNPDMIVEAEGGYSFAL